VKVKIVVVGLDRQIAAVNKVGATPSAAVRGRLDAVLQEAAAWSRARAHKDDGSMIASQRVTSDFNRIDKQWVGQISYQDDAVEWELKRKEDHAEFLFGLTNAEIDAAFIDAMRSHFERD